MAVDHDCGEAFAVLARVIERSGDSAQREWLAAALAAARDSRDAQTFVASYAGAGRRLRATPAIVARDDAAALESCGLRRVDTWTLDRVARTALLCAVAAQGDAGALVESVYRSGDNDERIALLGALAALPEPQRFASTAVDACRTNVTSVFEAIACDNPYPAAHFSGLAFNQMILKALFLGVPVSRIEGLSARCNGELVRMVAAYASERRAAGRSVPVDVDVILSLEARAS